MIFSQIKREQVVTTIGELIEAKTEVANIVVDVLSGEIEMFDGIWKSSRPNLQLWTQRRVLPRRRKTSVEGFAQLLGSLHFFFMGSLLEKCCLFRTFDCLSSTSFTSQGG